MGGGAASHDSDDAEDYSDTIDIADDTVSLRVWCTERTIITLRSRKLMNMVNIARACEGGKGHGPRDVGDLLERVVSVLVVDVADRVNIMDDTLGRVETTLAKGVNRGDSRPAQLQQRLGRIRYQTAALHHYLHPQLIAIDKLSRWLESHQAKDYDRISEHIKTLEASMHSLDNVRDRAAVLREEMDADASQRMHKLIVVLTMLTAVFLPLQLLLELHSLGHITLPFVGHKSNANVNQRKQV